MDGNRSTENVGARLKPLDFCKFDPEAIICADVETFYDSASRYSLKYMPVEHYVRDSRFETIGWSIDDGDECQWMEHEEFKYTAKYIDWGRCAVLAHNCAFDGFVLSERYDVHPGFLLDTLSMARALHGLEVGNSLAKLSAFYGVGEKGYEVENANGKRRADFSKEEWLRYGEYSKNDARLCRALFLEMVKAGFPESELWVIDLTLKMATEPMFVVDSGLLEKAIADEREKKRWLLERIEKDKSIVMSNKRFADLLVELGEEPPRKISPRTGKEAYAFAKTDPAMQALLEHERDEVRWAAEARVAVKSTINESRAERLLGVAGRGRLPVFLNYYGAHTGRWSGGGKMNLQNLVRGGFLRQALRAP